MEPEGYARPELLIAPRQLGGALGMTAIPPSPPMAAMPLIVDAQGQKLSKSMASLPIDDDDPLPALLAAWQALGQPVETLVGIGNITGAMQAASRGFRPERLPKVTCMTFAASMTETVPSVMLLTSTSKPSSLTATPCAPLPVLMVSTTLSLATSMTDTVSAGSASVP